jgi:hypothetical protein
MEETNQFDYLDKLCDFAQFDVKTKEYHDYNIGYKENKMNMENIPDFMALWRSFGFKLHQCISDFTSKNPDLFFIFLSSHIHIKQIKSLTLFGQITNVITLTLFWSKHIHITTYVIA